MAGDLLSELFRFEAEGRRLGAEQERRVIVAWLEKLRRDHIDPDDSPVDSNAAARTFVNCALAQLKDGRHIRALEAGELAEFLEVDGD